MRAVCLLSNYPDSRDISTVKRINKHGTTENVPCQQLLIDYNKYNMNGVDKFDQIKLTYEVDRKSTEYFSSRCLYC